MRASPRIARDRARRSAAVGWNQNDTLRVLRASQALTQRTRSVSVIPRLRDSFDHGERRGIFPAQQRTSDWWRRVNPLLQSLSAVFQAGVALRHVAYRRGWLKIRRLNRPVVSVGNLSVGGTGKTPLVILMAETLLAGGHRPCILTRGYGRRGGKGLMVL